MHYYDTGLVSSREECARPRGSVGGYTKQLRSVRGLQSDREKNRANNAARVEAEAARARKRKQAHIDQTKLAYDKLIKVL